MFGQTFSPGDVATIAALIGLEGLLSADNALVLAIMVQHLPAGQRQKALLYGLWGAFVLRTIAILGAGLLTKFWWVQLIGALYLIYLPLKHWMPNRRDSEGREIKAAPRSFWMTVLHVEIVDIAFAIDSVLVGVSFANIALHPEKTWVVIVGAIIGIVLLRFAAGAFIRLLERYPRLEHLAYALVGWAGLKLLLASGHTWEQPIKAANLPSPIGFWIPAMPPALFWAGVLIITAAGSYFAYLAPVEIDSTEADEAQHEIESETEPLPDAESETVR